MKKIILAAAAASSLLFGGIGAASAMTAGAIPLASDSAPAVTLVSGGCGPAFHRGPYGGCRPNFGGYGGRGPGWRGPGWRGPGWHRGGWHRW
jgi:hypothetical protein